MARVHVLLLLEGATIFFSRVSSTPRDNRLVMIHKRLRDIHIAVSRFERANAQMEVVKATQDRIEPPEGFEHCAPYSDTCAG